jgi:hypothetical protein
MERGTEARIGGPRDWNVVEAGTRSEIRVARRFVGVRMHLVAGSDEVAGQLDLLTGKAAHHIEMGIDQCDPHSSARTPWQPQTVTPRKPQN